MQLFKNNFKTTNEDSASDSSEADADPAKDVSDGTEVVA